MLNIFKTFVFRKVAMPIVRQRGVDKYGGGGQWWYAELHLSNSGIFGPAALATIHDNEVLDLFVLDSVRGKGYGTALIKAAGKRFGVLRWCDTAASRGFHESLVRKGIARVTLRHDSTRYEFIPKKCRALKREQPDDQRTAARNVGTT